MGYTFKTLTQEYNDSMSGFIAPYRAMMYCPGCRKLHDGIVAYRYGQYNYYFETDDGQAVSVDTCPNLPPTFELTPPQEIIWQQIYRDEGLDAALDWYKTAIAGAKK